MRTLRRHLALSPVLLGIFTACLPYTVGSTARTVPHEEVRTSSSYYFIPNAIRSADDTVGVPLPGVDVEMRYGLDARSDVGLRALPLGLAVDYKHRVDSDRTGTGTALAYMVGGGIVNGGAHVMLQGTLIASAREDIPVSPYGGVRIIHVIPIEHSAVRDRPSIGGFGGVQLGVQNLTIRPELGIFYDHSALDLRSRDVIFVPAITIQRRARAALTEGLLRRPRLPGRGTSGSVDHGGECGMAVCRPRGPTTPAGTTRVP